MEREIVVVTGANSGFGKSTAEAFVKDKRYKVIATDKKESIHDQFEEYPDVITATLDIRDPEQIKSVVEWVKDSFSEIDILVNSGGIQNSGTPDSYLDKYGNPTPELTEMYETNLRGPILMMQSVIPLMLQQNSGLIFNISSCSENNRSTFRHPYADYKAVLTGVTYRFADTYRDEGIRIINIQPGIHRTKLDVPRKWTPDTYSEDAGAAQATYDWWRANIGANPDNVGRAIYDVANGTREAEPIHISVDGYEAHGERLFIGWDARLTAFMKTYVPGWEGMYTAGCNIVFGTVKLGQHISQKDYWVDQSGSRD